MGTALHRDSDFCLWAWAVFLIRTLTRRSLTWDQEVGWGLGEMPQEKHLLGLGVGAHSSFSCGVLLGKDEGR